MGGASNNGGIVLQWLQEDFFRSSENVPDFLNQASSVEPGAEGYFSSLSAGRTGADLESGCQRCFVRAAISITVRRTWSGLPWKESSIVCLVSASRFLKKRISGIFMQPADLPVMNSGCRFCRMFLIFRFWFVKLLKILPGEQQYVE